jgi:hypothetical protein
MADAPSFPGARPLSAASGASVPPSRLGGSNRPVGLSAQAQAQLALAASGSQGLGGLGASAASSLLASSAGLGLGLGASGGVSKGRGRNSGAAAAHALQVVLEHPELRYVFAEALGLEDTPAVAPQPRFAEIFGSSGPAAAQARATDSAANAGGHSHGTRASTPSSAAGRRSGTPSMQQSSSGMGTAEHCVPPQPCAWRQITRRRRTLFATAHLPPTSALSVQASAPLRYCFPEPALTQVERETVPLDNARHLLECLRSPALLQLVAEPVPELKELPPHLTPGHRQALMSVGSGSSSSIMAQSAGVAVGMSHGHGAIRAASVPVGHFGAVPLNTGGPGVPLQQQQVVGAQSAGSMGSGLLAPQPQHAQMVPGSQQQHISAMLSNAAGRQLQRVQLQPGAAGWEPVPQDVLATSSRPMLSDDLTDPVVAALTALGPGMTAKQIANWLLDNYTAETTKNLTQRVNGVLSSKKNKSRFSKPARNTWALIK